MSLRAPRGADQNGEGVIMTQLAEEIGLTRQTLYAAFAP